MSQAPAIAVDGLCKRYRRRLGIGSAFSGGVHDVSLRIEAGQAWLLAGPNGAGKSTTLHCILGLLRPDRGQVRVLGQPPRASRQHIGYQAEIFATSSYLTASEVLQLFGRLAGMSWPVLAQRSEELLRQLGLWSVRGDKVGTYSKGMLQRLGVAQSLLARPQVVIWDEPTSGLDPTARRQVLDLALAIKASGATMLICTHVLADMTPLCDHVAVMVQGQVAVAGPVAALLAARSLPDLEALYLATTGHLAAGAGGEHG